MQIFFCLYPDRDVSEICRGRISDSAPSWKQGITPFIGQSFDNYHCHRHIFHHLLNRQTLKLYNHLKIRNQALVCLQQYKLQAQHMLLICLNVAVNGFQIQRLCIFLSKWNSEKVYARFLTNERFEIVGSVLKRREVFHKMFAF